MIGFAAFIAIDWIRLSRTAAPPRREPPPHVAPSSFIRPVSAKPTGSSSMSKYLDPGYSLWFSVVLLGWWGHGKIFGPSASYPFPNDSATSLLVICLFFLLRALEEIHRAIVSAMEVVKSHHRDRDRNIEAFYQQLQWQTEALNQIRSSLGR
jgi:hypothetical protein